MDELAHYQAQANKEETSSLSLVAIGTSLSGGFLVLASASVLAPPVAIGLATLSATVGFVGAVNRITQPEFQSLQREKISEILSQTPQQEKPSVIELEDKFQQATDRLEHNTMLVPLIGLGAVLTSSFPIVFPAVLGAYGVYKAIELVKNRRDFVQSAEDISSLHNKIMSFRNQPSTPEKPQAILQTEDKRSGPPSP